MIQAGKTKSQVNRELRKKIFDKKEQINRLIDSNKKLNQYKPPLTSGTKKYKLERLNKLKVERNKKKMELYNIEIEMTKVELSLLNY